MLALPSGMSAHKAPATRATVMVHAPVGLLDYNIPASWVDAVQVGTAVRVPLGPRQMTGYVVATSDDAHPDGITLKDLAQLDPDRPALPEQVIRLLLFGAQYYCVPIGEMLAVALPSMARPPSSRFVLTLEGTALGQDPDASAAQAVEVPAPTRTICALAHKHPGGLHVKAVERALGLTRVQANHRLRQLCKKGLLRKATGQSKPRQAALYTRLADRDASVLGPRQAGARSLWEQMPIGVGLSAAQLAALDAKAPTRIKALHKAGLVERATHVVRQAPHAFPEAMSESAQQAAQRPLTDEQSKSLAAIVRAVDGRDFHAFLLHGVTGSGKTEVYLRAIAATIAAGRTALILVPEIALTPQLGSLFRERFGSQVATFHSGLSAAQRRDEWERVAQGDALIGLGARSALFLPLHNVGIIIVDEEHETSFKQDASPRYHGRDLAVFRARQENAVVVLGSATPALETYANSTSGRYTRLHMPSRVHSRPLPEVTCVPLAETEKVGDGVFTEPLAVATERALKQNEQVILFLNRRGFASYVFCHDCGHAYRCESCDVSLTLHRGRNRLICHYCGFEMGAPETCASCEGCRVGAFGLGTERVEAEVRALFGNVSTVRLDRDVVRTRAQLERSISEFKSGAASIMVGTQMVAKGHDFPGVTLVGVISADASLNFPDFRAAERTFSLLTQVAGRAGRGDKPGYVLVQAYETQHYAIEAAQHHDYESFVEQELETRRELFYPPFSHLALLRFEGPSEAATQQAAKAAAAHLTKVSEDLGGAVMILGPAPAPIARVRNDWRFQILLKAPQRSLLRTVLDRAHAAGGPRQQDVRRILDIDPLNML